MRISCSLATSLDAKITPPGVLTHVELTSNTDIEKLKRLRDDADAILFGGGSFRAFAGVRKGLRSDRIPLQCILTRDGRVDPSARAFRRTDASFIVFARELPDLRQRTAYPECVTWVQTSEDGRPSGTIATIVAELERRSVSHMLIEGGGKIVGMFLEGQRIDELFLTYTPQLYGDRGTPDMVQGVGFSQAASPRAELLSVEKVENEIFVHARLHYPPVERS
jgi:5-amino-6-(5-phosphoribosylamino)uracil reductase